MRRFARYFAQTNRLRTLGTDHLLAVGRAAGVKRFVAQSYAGGIFARVGGPVKDEGNPVDTNPPEPVRPTIAAIQHLEEAVTSAGGIEGTLIQAIRERQLPLVGDATGARAYIHIADAAEATVQAIEGHGDASTTWWTTTRRRSPIGSLDGGTP